jgi:hypothetical protein
MSTAAAMPAVDAAAGAGNEGPDAADIALLPASTSSSVRTQPVLAVSSLGQTTRLNFALSWGVSRVRGASGVVNKGCVDKGCVPGKRGVFQPVKAPLAARTELLW